LNVVLNHWFVIVLTSNKKSPYHLGKGIFNLINNS
jgi:hypothetical protein